MSISYGVQSVQLYPVALLPDDAAYCVMLLMMCIENRFHLGHISGADHKNHANTHVENIIHFQIIHLAIVFNYLKNRGNRPGVNGEGSSQTLGDNAGYFFQEGTAGYMSYTLQKTLTKSGLRA